MSDWAILRSLDSDNVKTLSYEETEAIKERFVMQKYRSFCKRIKELDVNEKTKRLHARFTFLREYLDSSAIEGIRMEALRELSYHLVGDFMDIKKRNSFVG